MTKRPRKIYFVLGEESGDALGADLHAALSVHAAAAGDALEIIGLAGTKLQALGMESLFDIEDIAVMGLTAVVARLPTVVRRVYRTVDDIVRRQPDVVVLIDSPDFTHAVAKRVRKKLPGVPIINYVCPSVWAWRPGRAQTMRRYVDHVLAVLPFEPAALRRLNGPSATYVGHPLARKIADLGADSEPAKEQDKPMLLILPGSRNSELNQLLGSYGETVRILRDRGKVFDSVLPAVPQLKDRIIRDTADWPVRPEVRDSAENDKLFAQADAALIASGTVSLELALHGVPHVSGYRFDAITSQFLGLLKTWSANLPNLIADSVIVPEEINRMVMPERMARHIEPLLGDTMARSHQLEGFERVREAMKTERPTGELAAGVIFDHMKR